MVRAVRGGNAAVAATCYLAFNGIESPTPEQATWALLMGRAVIDLHTLALGKNTED